MSDGARSVSTRTELAAAMDGPSAEIRIAGRIEDVPTLTLPPGRSLRGEAGSSIRFRPGWDGLVLTSDNAVQGIELAADPDRRAIRNDETRPGLGRIELRELRVEGCVHILARGQVRDGEVVVDGLHIGAADARGYDDRAPGFGVEVLPGAFSLRNLQADPGSLLRADLRGISAGSADSPVRGTGVLVGGTPGGGRIAADLIETGEVHSDGGIAQGTADRISGGVFVVQGVEAAAVRNAGPVTTYGPNDMVLDNWGVVEDWHALSDVTSHGPSGIGFVNLGQLGTLTIDGVLETTGLGACGFNSGEVKQGGGADDPASSQEPVAGAVRVANLRRVVTRGDGAIGIQISVPAGRITVREGIETFGGTGESLARGVVTKLAAIALSVKPGGAAEALEVGGGLTTHGPGIEAMELHGRIASLRVEGSVGPSGGGFTAV